MKAYLVLDLAVHDFPAFKTYMEKNPPSSPSMADATSSGGRYPRQSKATGRPSGW